MTISIPRDMREASMCKGFESTLFSPTLDRLTNLPNGCITSFAKLQNMFNRKSASSRNVQKQTSDLYCVVQRYGESLREYIHQLIREKVSIPNCDIPAAIEAFRQGMYVDCDLYKDLTKYLCMMFEDASNKALAQDHLEDDMDARKEPFEPEWSSRKYT